ncbi:TIGR02186 family protein [Sphingosinicella sp. LY1275]|uniref:TIGR02186 family protein n=1 Tax=Sphingosinicella sp. LY1275 TaxID=3095379 RepID=UPI003A1030B0
MIWARILALLLLWPLTIGATEPKLVPDVSHRDIEIRYSFTGAELLLFGAIVYPDGRIPKTPDIAVVIKGPMVPIIVREKQKVAGIWMNVESERFRSAPSFYAVASSRPLPELIDERTAAIYELGLDNMQLSPGAGATPEERRRFEEGLIDLMKRRQLYLEDPTGVEITEGVLYRARVDIPARVPVGEYTAETFLIQDGRVVAAAVREIRIEKLGFERFVAMAAERWSFAYGLFAVLVSLLLGWGASALFRRT